MAGGSVWGRYDGATRFYYHKDALGTTRLVMNGAGTTVEWRDYYPFGLVMPGRSYLSGTAAKEGFTGKERDAETGLDYFGARYYLPALGRWGSVDPLAQDPAQVDKSPYAYTWNNPATLTDPDGKIPCKEIYGDGAPEGECLDEGEVVVEAARSDNLSVAGNLIVLTALSPIVGDEALVLLATATAIAVSPILVPIELALKQAQVNPVPTIVSPGWCNSVACPGAPGVLKYTPPPAVLPGFPHARRVRPRTWRKRWVDSNGDILEWDSQHGEVEVYDKQGNHKGAYNPDTGKQVKPPEPGRTTEK